MRAQIIMIMRWIEDWLMANNERINYDYLYRMLYSLWFGLLLTRRAVSGGGYPRQSFKKVQVFFVMVIIIIQESLQLSL